MRVLPEAQAACCCRLLTPLPSSALQGRARPQHSSQAQTPSQIPSQQPLPHRVTPQPHPKPPRLPWPYQMTSSPCLRSLGPPWVACRCVTRYVILPASCCGPIKTTSVRQDACLCMAVISPYHSFNVTTLAVSDVDSSVVGLLCLEGRVEIPPVHS